MRQVARVCYCANDPLQQCGLCGSALSLQQAGITVETYQGAKTIAPSALGLALGHLEKRLGAFWGALSCRGGTAVNRNWARVGLAT
jgi:hypothetical protein